MTKIKSAKYFEIKNKTNIIEGIKIIFEREDKSIYEGEYSVKYRKHSSPERIINQITKVRDHLFEIYKIFVSNTLPNFYVKSMKEISDIIIPLLVVQPERLSEEDLCGECRQQQCICHHISMR